MKNIFRLFCLAALVSVSSTASLGCAAADTFADCYDICSRYRDCYDSSYDVESCRSRCQDHEDEEDFVMSVDDCENCMDANSCSGTFVMCAAPCAGIVP